MVSRYWLILIALSLFIAGCSAERIPRGGRIPDKRYRSIVSLSPGSSELASQVQVKLAGRTSSCDYPPLIADVPVVMKGVKPDYEKIKELGADLVIYDRALFNEADLAKFKELKIDTLDLGGDTVLDWYDNIFKLGTMTGTETSCSEYVDRVEKSFAQHGSGSAGRKVAVLMPGIGTEHMILGKDSFIGDVVKRLGSEVVGPAGGLFQTANIEQLRSLNPDVIVVSGDATAVLKDSRLASTPAIRNGKVLAFKNSAILLRKGGRVDKLIEGISAAIGMAK